jgi:hypothetical protein
MAAFRSGRFTAARSPQRASDTVVAAIAFRRNRRGKIRHFDALRFTVHWRRRLGCLAPRGINWSPWLIGRSSAKDSSVAQVNSIIIAAVKQVTR